MFTLRNAKQLAELGIPGQVKGSSLLLFLLAAPTDEQ